MPLTVHYRQYRRSACIRAGIKHWNQAYNSAISYRQYRQRKVDLAVRKLIDWDRYRQDDGVGHSTGSSFPGRELQAGQH